MSGARPYIVRQGDYVAKIAAQTGCSEDEIWEHPKNDPLREGGRTKDVLHPGDVLYLPDEPVRARAVNLQRDNRHDATVPNVTVRLIFRSDGRPRENQAYRVLDLGAPIEGHTDEQGALSFEAPVLARFARVVFIEPFALYHVGIGYVDPMTESSGLARRLQQLGYLPLEASPEDVSGEDTRDLLKQFQCDQSLADTGEADNDTQGRLRREFGS